MPADKGFLEQLTGSPVDERAILDARRREMIGNRASGHGGLRQMMFGLGEMAGGGLGTGIAGLAGGVKGMFGADKPGFKAGFMQAANKADVGLVAAAAGITPNELVTRRRIRKELASETDDGSLESRIKLAEKAAQIANETGDSASLARALDHVQALKQEKAEFDKMNALTKKTQLDTAESSLVDAWQPDGTPVTGVLANSNGEPVAEAGGSPVGILVSDGQGGTKLMRFGEDLTREDPRALEKRAAGKEETIDERMRKLMKSGEPERIKALVIQGLQATRKYDRVMSTLQDLYNEGGVEQVIGQSGKIVGFVDNLVRNVKGTAGAFLPNAEDRKSGIRQRWMDVAKDAKDPIWDAIDLSPEFRKTGAAAQQHRANIMELAYMAARLAEPSNRGLSDNDIKNALTRIAGDTSNPQVMMRRFIEMMADGAMQVEDEIAAWHNSLEGVPNVEIDRFLGGQALPKFRREMGRIYDKYDVTFDDAGRAIFGEGSQVGDDVQPGEGVHGAPETPPTLEAERQERLNKILGKD